MGTVYAKDVQSDVGSIHEPTPPPPPQDNHKDISLADISVKVQKIHFEGLSRTKDDFVTKQVQDVFSASNFAEMVQKTQKVRVHMERLGLFKKVKVFIDTSKGPNAKHDGYEIFFKVQESRRLAGGISTLVGTNDGSLLFSLKLPNTFGRAEQLTAEYTYGTKATTGNSIHFTKPLGGNPSVSLSAAAFQFTGEYPWSGYKETDRGVSADFSFPSLFGNHNIRWEGVWRELGALSKSTSFAVREQAGHSLKSSVKHVWARERRDDRVIPTNGYFLKVTQELAGLGGDANFIKHDVELQLSKSLFFDTVIQLSLAGGIMKSLKPGADVKINDRFFLGGPLTLRGFNFKGVGPQDNGNSLGGDTYWLSGLHIYTPLPFRPGKGGFGDLFRTHFFVNAGNLRNIDLGDEWKENLHRLADTLRLSYGAGIVLKMGGIARLELNYCVPVKIQKGDSINPGLQFGIGINFL